MTTHGLLKFILFLMLVLGPRSSFCSEESSEKQYKDYVIEIASTFAEQMDHEYRLSWKRSGGNYFQDYIKSGIDFYALRRATIEEARALELVLMNKFYEAVNAHDKIKPYLDENSSAPETMQVRIEFVDADHIGNADGSISKIEYNQTEKNLKYYSQDLFNHFPDHGEQVYLRSFYEESYEDALRRESASPIPTPSIHQPTEYEHEIDRVLATFQKQMEYLYRLNFHSLGWMVHGQATPNIEEIHGYCTRYHPASQEQARTILVKVTEKLLKTLNNNEKLSPYLKVHPFSSNQLKIRINFREKRYFVGDSPYDDGTMESVVLAGNEITYWRGATVYAKESYLEAVQIIENTTVLQLVFEFFHNIVDIFIQIIKSIWSFLWLAITLFFWWFYSLFL